MNPLPRYSKEVEFYVDTAPNHPAAAVKVRASCRGFHVERIIPAEAIGLAMEWCLRDLAHNIGEQAVRE